MNKNIIIILLIFVIPLFAYFMLSQKNVSNLSMATSTRPHLIKFTSNMCGECVRVEPVIKRVMINYQDTVQYTAIPVQVNNEYNQKMISKYNVKLVPTIVILDKNGNIYKRIEGYVSETDLENYLKGVCK